MKQNVLVSVLAIFLIYLLCACTKGGAGQVSCVSREEGSGTRDAFVEMFEIVDDEGYDAIYQGAEITNSTSVMLTTVSVNENAVGYVSLGSLSDDVKTVSVDSVAPSFDSVKSGEYKISRPFSICYKDASLSDISQDFMKFILSSDGQKIISDSGYISVSDGGNYAPLSVWGKISIAGSTSVAPVMEILADEYKKLNPNVTIEIQQSGSSAGISSAQDGICDFGMSSRHLKESENRTLTDVTIAIDGIAVIVNKENTVTNLSSEQVRSLFAGETLLWSEIE